MRVFLIIALYCLLIGTAWAESRDPLGRPLREYGLILLATTLGGFVGWYRKVLRGEVRGSSLFALIGEFTTSSMAGMLCFFACDYFGWPLGLTAGACGLAGHMGGRAIELLERAALRRADRLLKGGSQ